MNMTTTATNASNSAQHVKCYQSTLCVLYDVAPLRRQLFLNADIPLLSATAENIMETSRGVDADPLPSSPFLPRYCFTHVLPIPLILYSFPFPLKFSKKIWGSFPYCPAKKDSLLQKLEGNKYSWSA